jgi:hypothetical protein
MVTVSVFVTLMTVYQSVWHHTLEDCNLDCKAFVTKCLNLYVLTSTELKHLSVSVSSEYNIFAEIKDENCFIIYHMNWVLPYNQNKDILVIMLTL